MPEDVGGPREILLQVLEVAKFRLREEVEQGLKAKWWRGFEDVTNFESLVGKIFLTDTLEDDKYNVGLEEELPICNISKLFELVWNV